MTSLDTALGQCPFKQTVAGAGYLRGREGSCPALSQSAPPLPGDEPRTD